MNIQGEENHNCIAHQAAKHQVQWFVFCVNLGLRLLLKLELESRSMALAWIKQFVRLMLIAINTNW